MAWLTPKIRRLQPKQIPELVDMAHKAMAYPWSESVFLDCLKAHYHIWLLSQSQQVIGFIVVLDQVDELQIMNICVNPPHQRQGYAHQLLRHAIQYAQLKHLRRITLDVRASNQAAISIYHSVGFIDVGVRKGYYRAMTGREDALLMTLTLPS